MRSRYAQLGIDFVRLATRDARQRDTSENQWLNFQNGVPLQLSMWMHNYCKRPVELSAGVGLFRFYFNLSAELLLEETLEKAVGQGLISIYGERGTDWELNYDGPITKGVLVRINKDRFWIPPHPQNEVISISDMGGNYRDEIDQLFEPIQHSEEKILWIGETPTITLDKSINAEVPIALRTTDYVEGVGFVVRDGGQIMSSLFDAGINMPARVEIRSATNKSMPSYIPLNFYKDSGKPISL